MRYFQYISDSKLEMLGQQLEMGDQGVTKSELGFNLGLLNGKIGSERKPSEHRYAKLLAVESHIRKNERVGTVDDPSSWIEGEATAIATLVPEKAGAVFYFLKTEQTYVALGGSVGHLIGGRPERKSSFGLSFAPDLISSLFMIEELPQLHNWDDRRLAELAEEGVAGGHPWAVMIFNQCHHRRSRTFNLPIRFLARRILVDYIVISG